MKVLPAVPLKDYIDGHTMASGDVEADLIRGYIDTHAVEPSPQASFVLRWPVALPDFPIGLPTVITQAYGIHPQWYKPFGLPGHEGIDIRALTGTPVMAMADGTVSLVQPNALSGPYGVQVRLKHKHGEDEYTTVYAHFTKGSIKVSLGQAVKAGDVLGLADNTGNSSGPHLHITLKHKGKGSVWMHTSDIVNPTPYFAEMFPGKGWLVDVGGNLRSGPGTTYPILRWIAASSKPVQAVEVSPVEGGDWWKIRTPEPTVGEGWFWNPGYKLRAVA